MREQPRKTPLTLVRPLGTAPVGPPRQLGEPGLALWHSVQTEFDVRDCGGVELLMQACLMADRVTAMAAQIEADGEIVHNKSGPRKHPLLRAELQGRILVPQPTNGTHRFQAVGHRDGL